MQINGGFSRASRQAALLALLALSGCSSVPYAVNPVEWYRDLSGASKNDAQDASRNNAANLEAGSKGSYPNLGTVPPPPTRALSSVDREKLQRSLASDRENAKYSDEDVRAYRPPSAIPTDAPPRVASTQPARQTRETPPSQPAARSTPQPETAAPAPAPTRPSPEAQASLAAREAPASREARPARESTLTSPTPRAASDGDEVRPAPPPPRLASTPGAPAPGRLVDAGAVTFRNGSSALSDEGLNVIMHVAGQQKRSGGTVRIVGHARRGVDAGDRDDAGFRLALDRANVIALALVDAGVEVRNLAVEAAPMQTAEAGRTGPRSEIYLEY